MLLKNTGLDIYTNITSYKVTKNKDKWGASIVEKMVGFPTPRPCSSHKNSVSLPSLSPVTDYHV